MPVFPRLFARLFAAWCCLARMGADDGVTVPRFTHPGAGQIFYFVLTDRFANGRTDNDTGGMAGGPEATGFDPARTSHYHGGDFAGLMAHLDYLQGLGITAIWLTPPLKNKPVQSGTAGYHGYWITDFLHTDPHLGSNEEFRELIRRAHARGLKVYMDIITNHTADVIQYAGGAFAYRNRDAAPYRDAAGRVFDERAVAFNGLNEAAAFPALAADTSFPYRPVVPAGELAAKSPAWLNDVTLYHNRGNSTFAGENATLGDFAGLDDLFTEHPRVVQGFIEIFAGWLDAGVDGSRIDTTRHVNAEFWQAFIPAIRARARALGRPDFLQFGEVYNDAGDPALLSEFSTGGLTLDATLDFGFFAAARRFVSAGGSSEGLADFFARDDYYTDHDSNVHSTTTFLGNHDAGRFAYFLERDNPGASPAQLADLDRLGHGLLLLARGQPVIYYGDEQGMIGRGGSDMHAREDMFASRAPAFRSAPLLATTRTGADDKFDPSHPFYRLIAQLAALRAEHATLRTGAMLPRVTADPDLFAFSRFDRQERIEYLAAFNRSRTRVLTVAVPTSQPPGAALRPLFTSGAATATGNAIVIDAEGRAMVTLPPLQFAVWRASAPLGDPPAVHLAWANPAAGAGLVFQHHEGDGLAFTSRVELRVDAGGGDGFGEVTFTLARASRPGQVEYLGTDDAPPYRVFWSPPNDLAIGDHLTLTATHDDRRGHRTSASVADVTVAAEDGPTGIVNSHGPVLTQAPAATRAAAGERVTLAVAAEGTAPLEYQWLEDGEEIPGATDATFSFPAAGASSASYRVLVRNRAGTVISAPAKIPPKPGG